MPGPKREKIKTDMVYVFSSRRGAASWDHNGVHSEKILWLMFEDGRNPEMTHRNPRLS